MRYDSARLSDFSAGGEAAAEPALTPDFFTMALILLAAGVVMVLSSSYARAYYDPGR